ncbi:YrdB family protein [Fredinandcohnia sp. 179-A 10B2 NHS]|uniref:YrdB family protein n=1 Tax=Fredinandcohnia sp. 179-A 10B2 NHS TaxID=3235176 RepID=UPI0039A2D138
MLLKSLNIGVRFLLELCVLASLGYWGFTLDKGMFLKWGVGIGAPLIAAVIWGTFIAPKSPYLLDEPMRLVVEILIFAAAFFALYFSGNQGFAWALAVVAVINRTLLVIWKQ